MFFNKTAFQFEFFCFTWLFGEFDEPFISLLVLLAIDFLTGVVCAIINHKFRCAAFWKGLIKKTYILILICAVNVLTVHSFGINHFIRDYVLCILSGYEFLSIVDHIRRLKIKIPKKVNDLLNLFFEER